MLAQLGDRVVNLGYTRAPLGLRGTVVAIYPSTAYVTVLFDEEFTGGSSLARTCNKKCCGVVRWEHLLPLAAQGAALAPASFRVVKTAKLEQAPASEEVMAPASTAAAGGSSTALVCCVRLRPQLPVCAQTQQ